MIRFERVASHRIYQQIVDQISRMMSDGTLKPGDRLPPERQLAEEFGVSRPAVREALSALNLMGLVEVRHGEGAFVQSVPFEGMMHSMALFLAMEQGESLGRELLEIRAALEAEGAALAAERREEDDLTALAEALQKMECPLSPALAATSDWDFHRAVAAASDNSLLLQVMRMLAETMKEYIASYREKLLQIPGNHQLLYDEHRGIFETIRDRQPDLARDRMHAHILRVRQTLYGTVPTDI